MDPAGHELHIPDPCLVVLVGAAGAGKSTFAARHFAPDAVLSSDAFREQVSGDPADQGATRAAFAALHRAVRRRLLEGRLTVVDATNVRAEARRALVREAVAARMPAVAIVLDLDGRLVHQRNAARGGRPAVPADVVERHLGNVATTLAPGRLDREGFLRVIVLRDPAEIEALAVVPGPAAPGSAPGR